MTYHSTITSKGQTTIPVGVRDILNLLPGDRLGYIVNANNTVTIVPETLDVSDLVGILPKPKGKLSIEEMNNVIAAAGKKKGQNNDRY